MSMSQSQLVPRAQVAVCGFRKLPRETSLPFQITFRRDHLEACLLSLGCDVMARERSNFETYSMCYEHVLQHAREKLRQREQVGSQGRS